jgi:signal transduction histidine kinase
MDRAIRFQNHPFRFLLYLEWALLAIATASLLTPAPPIAITLRRFQPPLDRFPLLSLLCILAFGLLGLWLPTGRLITRLGHIAGQILLIGLTSLLGFGGGRLFPFMYLVLVIRSCFMFGLGGRIATTGIAFWLFLLALHWRVQFITAQLPLRVAGRLRHFLTNVQLNLVFLFALALVFVLLLVNALITERQSREELKQANAQLRQSAAEIERLAMAQERSRIARDIHDSLGHSLTALNIQLEGALKLAEKNPQQAQTFLTEAKRLGSVALQDVRQSVATLRGDPLQGNSLESAIATLFENFQQTTGIQPCSTLQLPDGLSPPTCMALYRILQESLTNIVKHAQATTVTVAIIPHGNQLTLTVEDNGRGFQLSRTGTGYGLQGMRERAETAGGSLSLTSQPGQGSRLTVTLPISKMTYDSRTPG